MWYFYVPLVVLILAGLGLLSGGGGLIAIVPFVLAALVALLFAGRKISSATLSRVDAGGVPSSREASYEASPDPRRTATGSSADTPPS